MSVGRSEPGRVDGVIEILPLFAGPGFTPHLHCEPPSNSCWRNFLAIGWVRLSPRPNPLHLPAALSLSRLCQSASLLDTQLHRVARFTV